MARKLTRKQIAAGFGGKRAQSALRGRRSSKSSKSKSATSSARSRGARKAAKTRSKLGWKVRNWVKKHPIATTAIVGGAAGGTTLAVSEGARQATTNTLAAARARLPF